MFKGHLVLFETAQSATCLHLHACTCVAANAIHSAYTCHADHIFVLLDRCRTVFETLQHIKMCQKNRLLHMLLRNNVLVIIKSYLQATADCTTSSNSLQCCCAWVLVWRQARTEEGNHGVLVTAETVVYPVSRVFYNAERPWLSN